MINLRKGYDLSSTLDFVSNAWDASFASQVDYFSILDKHLLRLLFNELHEYITTNLPAPHPTLESLVATASNSLGGLPTSHYNFLTDAKPFQYELDIFSEAIKPIANPFSCSDSPLPILARSFLITRLATGIAMDLLKKASIGANDMSFWLKILCNDLGYVNGAHPALLKELQFDIEFAVEAIREWREENPGPITLKTFLINFLMRLDYFHSYNA
jgi:hypothetical protein